MKIIVPLIDSQLYVIFIAVQHMGLIAGEFQQKDKLRTK